MQDTRVRPTLDSPSYSRQAINVATRAKYLSLKKQGCFEQPLRANSVVIHLHTRRLPTTLQTELVPVKQRKRDGSLISFHANTSKIAVLSLLAYKLSTSFEVWLALYLLQHTHSTARQHIRFELKKHPMLPKKEITRAPSSQPVGFDEPRQPQRHHFHKLGSRAQVNKPRPLHQHRAQGKAAKCFPRLMPRLGKRVVRRQRGAARRQVCFETTSCAVSPRQPGATLVD